MSAFVGNVSASVAFRRQPLRPARRGQRKCLCNGVLHETKGHYGWILPTDDIEHTDAQKHQGGIYLDTRDIRPGSPLVRGDEVKFYLYVDSRGLGAEDCHLKVQAPSPKPQRPGGNFTLNLADLLDGDIENKEDVQKKPKAEGSDTASTASGTRSGPSSPRVDFENDPILRMLLQPRMKMSKPEMKLSTDSILSDTASTAVDSNSSHSSPETVLTEPSLVEEKDSSALDDADLFATLRSELREARARAESTKTAATAVVPAGFRAPPGLLAPPGLPAPKCTVTKAEAAFADLSASLGLAGTDIEPPPGLF